MAGRGNQQFINLNIGDVSGSVLSSAAFNALKEKVKSEAQAALAKELVGTGDRLQSIQNAPSKLATKMTFHTPAHRFDIDDAKSVVENAVKEAVARFGSEEGGGRGLDQDVIDRLTDAFQVTAGRDKDMKVINFNKLRADSAARVPFVNRAGKPNTVVDEKANAVFTYMNDAEKDVRHRLSGAMNVQAKEDAAAAAELENAKETRRKIYAVSPSGEGWRIFSDKNTPKQLAENIHGAAVRHETLKNKLDFPQEIKENLVKIRAMEDAARQDAEVQGMYAAAGNLGHTPDMEGVLALIKQRGSVPGVSLEKLPPSHRIQVEEAMADHRDSPARVHSRNVRAAARTVQREKTLDEIFDTDASGTQGRFYTSAAGERYRRRKQRLREREEMRGSGRVGAVLRRAGMSAKRAGKIGRVFGRAGAAGIIASVIVKATQQIIESIYRAADKLIERGNEASSRSVSTLATGMSPSDVRTYNTIREITEKRTGGQGTVDFVRFTESAAKNLAAFPLNTSGLEKAIEGMAMMTGLSGGGAEAILSYAMSNSQDASKVTSKFLSEAMLMLASGESNIFGKIQGYDPTDRGMQSSLLNELSAMLDALGAGGGDVLRGSFSLAQQQGRIGDILGSRADIAADPQKFLREFLPSMLPQAAFAGALQNEPLDRALTALANEIDNIRKTFKELNTQIDKDIGLKLSGVVVPLIGTFERLGAGLKMSFARILNVDTDVSVAKKNLETRDEVARASEANRSYAVAIGSGAFQDLLGGVMEDPEKREASMEAFNFGSMQKRVRVVSINGFPVPLSLEQRYARNMLNAEDEMYLMQEYAKQHRRDKNFDPVLTSLGVSKDEQIEGRMQGEISLELSELAAEQNQALVDFTERQKTNPQTVMPRGVLEKDMNTVAQKTAARHQQLMTDRVMAAWSRKNIPRPVRGFMELESVYQERLADWEKTVAPYLDENNIAAYQMGIGSNLDEVQAGVGDRAQAASLEAMERGERALVNLRSAIDIKVTGENGATGTITGQRHSVSGGSQGVNVESVNASQ